MKLSRTYLIGLISLLLVQSGFGQFKENLDYIDNYYIFPIKPGLRNSLAGTMGELRSNHFHAGIDIRTEGRIGLPVHAAAKGYVSRIAVSTTGYGNAIYLSHPNGETTVYAHLDRFTGELAEYVLREQYRRKTFKLNLYFRKGQFVVDQGDTIAYSGNSGSSGGPHLHFDIRDKNQNPLNPLTYGFTKEVYDNTSPVVKKLAIKTLNKDARVNGQFGRFEFIPRRVGNNYVIDKPIEASGEIGIELYAYDLLDNSRFRCGINKITMEVDSTEVFRQIIDTFSFAEQRNILAHMNYQDLYSSGERFHKLYVDDGNLLRFYKTDNRKGKLFIREDDQKFVQVAMTDTYGNQSFFNFNLKFGKQVKSTEVQKVVDKVNTKVMDNTLAITAPIQIPEANNQLTINTRPPNELTRAYNQDKNNSVYLWDLREGLPQSIIFNEERHALAYDDIIPSVSSYEFYDDLVDITFPNKSLFDTLYLATSYEYDSTREREVFEIGDPFAPLRKNISITFKPKEKYTDIDKAHVYFLNGSNVPSYEGGAWTAGKIKIKTRRFGKYTILHDTVPPVITPVSVNTANLRFKIKDNLSGIKQFECKVDGRWVLMNYDHKRQLIWSEKLTKDQPFKGPVRLVVTDNANNKTEYTKQIN